MGSGEAIETLIRCCRMLLMTSESGECMCFGVNYTRVTIKQRFTSFDIEG